ncbi:extensin family protein [Aliirhizobium terrae]|uniref:extensin family protein n=1 Tax=Terrirhizobium terrae TaxID=2926709 RepID=UPI002577717D|nr:extensin family protein [Rhizobium sp. CC-CFT758]WJH40441.1 extensin family protein [Rhizobium sp. CC-CFT758]
MKRSLYLLALGMPLMLGASLPPTRPIPQAQPADVVEVNVIDRFLQDAGVRKRPSSQRTRTRSQANRGVFPKPPAIASVPLPLPKPTQNAQAAPANEQAQTEDKSGTTPTPQEKPAEPEKAETAPGKPAERETATPSTSSSDTAPPSAAKPETAKADEPPSPATPAPTDGAASPPVVQQPATANEPAREAEVPKPLAKPETDEAATDNKGPATKNDQEPAKDGETAADETKPDGKAAEEGEKAEAEPPPPPLVKEDPQELQACLADLKAIGAKFEATDPINEGNGCGIEHPIDVAEVLPGVDLGGATMRCKTALTMAHWLKDTAQPALDIAMPGRKIVRLVPGSTYQCRLRNNASTGKISEHARGNAFDVAAFKLDNGETIEMKPRDEDSTLEGAFQRTATAGACLHFTTVLSPGSDAAHEDHLHLDVMERKGGYRYCR